ncbi:hypothetical protein BVY03_06050, partial [bacterium K02(2017)]
GELPLERKLVTPESMYMDEDLYVVYSNVFGVKVEEPNKVSETAKIRKSVNKKVVFKKGHLAGRWSGDYTINKLNIIQMDISLRKNGEIQKGVIYWNEQKKISILDFEITEFHPSGKFKAKLMDARGVHAKINAKITKDGKGVLGHWKDHLGYDGVFSLQKR